MEIETDGQTIFLTLSAEEAHRTSDALIGHAERWPEGREREKASVTAAVIRAAANLVELNSKWEAC